jgi:error-prone DNA polymerase
LGDGQLARLSLMSLAVLSRVSGDTAKGTAFLALEDEGGLINVVLRPEVYEAHHEALRSPFVVVEGKLQRRGQAISVLARRVGAVAVRRS